jgi:hypothetical protein
MAFQDEVLEGYFASLGKSETYARAYWAHLKGEGQYPQPKDYCITDNAAQDVRIKLAGIR